MTVTGLSVLTPTKGRPEVLLAKARSLLAQSLPSSSFEWIVVFDGPDPRLEDALSRTVGDAFRLRTVTTEGVGAGPARDLAAASATFDVLYLSDDDCMVGEHTLARHLQAQAEPALYLGDVVFVGPESEERWSPRAPGWWNVGGANASISRAAFEAVGGFGDDVRGYGGEDLWLGWRLYRAGLELRWVRDAPVRHIGPNPQRASTPQRARQAGANAARIGALEPRLRWRLGVHPALLRVKLTVLPLLARCWGARFGGELAYSRGAWREIHLEEAANR